jgi:hypothetical protein
MAWYGAGIRIVVSIALAGSLMACSSTEQAGKALQSVWIGRSADDFFRQYGPPASSYTLSDGGKIFEWVGGQTSVYLPGSASTTTTVFANTAVSNTQFSPGGNLYLGCKIRITTTRAGTISTIAPSGDTLGMWQMSRCAEIFVR